MGAKAGMQRRKHRAFGSSIYVVSAVIAASCACSAKADPASAKAEPQQTSLMQRATQIATSVSNRIATAVRGPQAPNQLKPSAPQAVVAPPASVRSQTSASVAQFQRGNDGETAPGGNGYSKSPTSASPKVLGPPPVRDTRVSLIGRTPVFLLPDPERTPLRVLDAGTVVTFLDADGDWYHVSFRDPRWGTRFGYLDGRSVEVSLPRDLSVPALITSQQPVDLSVRIPEGEREKRPVAAKTKKPADGDRAGASRLKPLDLSVHPANEPVDLSVPRQTPPNEPVDLSIRRGNR